MNPSMWQRVKRELLNGVLVLVFTNFGFFVLGGRDGSVSPLNAEACFVILAVVVVYLPAYLRHRLGREL